MSLDIIDLLNRKEETVVPRAKKQINKIISIAIDLKGKENFKGIISNSELADLAEFVGECLDAKR